MTLSPLVEIELETLWSAWDAALHAVAEAQRTLITSVDPEQALVAERALLHAELRVANVADALRIAYGARGAV